jgi:hypothetical protein
VSRFNVLFMGSTECVALNFSHFALLDSLFAVSRALWFVPHFALTDSFFDVPKALWSYLMFCVVGLDFDSFTAIKVGFSFCTQGSFLVFSGALHLGSMFCSLSLIFTFCTPILIFCDSGGGGVAFKFSRFAFLDSFLAVPKAFRIVFTLCASGLVMGDFGGVARFTLTNSFSTIQKHCVHI